MTDGKFKGQVVPGKIIARRHAHKAAGGLPGKDFALRFLLSFGHFAPGFEASMSAQGCLAYVSWDYKTDTKKLLWHPPKVPIGGKLAQLVDVSPDLYQLVLEQLNSCPDLVAKLGPDEVFLDYLRVRARNREYENPEVGPLEFGEE